MQPILTKKTNKYLIPRMSVGKTGKKFFVSFFILIEVRAVVLKDQSTLRIRKVRALSEFSSSSSLFRKMDWSPLSKGNLVLVSSIILT